jgi:hypothetical protein
MKALPGLAALLLFTLSGSAQETVAEYNWNDLARKSLLHGATPVSIDGRAALKIENTNDTPLQISLLTIEKPGITAVTYALTGEVRYASVKGDGFLEMWNYYPSSKPGWPEEGYFSRTLGDSGPMGKITGTSDWRPFILPFDRTGTSNPPIRLQVNLILRGSGTVYLSPVKLVQYPNAKSGGAFAPGEWWSNRTAGLVGGTGGAFIGCLGSLLGWLAWKGRARGFVTVSLVILTAFGGVLAVLGLVALAENQPYAVWFPLVVGAILLLGICPYRWRQYHRKYEELELRRISSLDASGA